MPFRSIQAILLLEHYFEAGLLFQNNRTDSDFEVGLILNCWPIASEQDFIIMMRSSMTQHIPTMDFAQ